MSVEAIKKVRRVLEIFSTSEAEVRPHCVVVGPSGSGKSHEKETKKVAFQKTLSLH